MNLFVLQGNLTGDPQIEIVNTANGPVSKCKFTVAVKRPHSTETTDFFQCTAWRKTAESIAKFFKKGNKILISGRTEYRKFVDSTNTVRYAYDWIVDEWEFCESANKGAIASVPPTDFSEQDTGTYIVDVNPTPTEVPKMEKVERDFSIDSDLPF